MDTYHYDILYNELYNKSNNTEDETFINDLNIYDIFNSINHTKTVIGKQYLYHTLCTPKQAISEIENLETKVTYLHSNENLKQSFLKGSIKLTDTNTYLLPELFFCEKLLQPKYNKIAPYLLITETLILLLSFYSLTVLAILIPLLLVNTLIHLINKNRLYLFRKTYAPVTKLLETAKSLKGKDTKNVFVTTEVDVSIKSLSPLRTKLNILTIVDYFSTSELFMIPFVLVEILKSLTLFEVLLTKSLISAINEKKKAIENLYELIGKIDLAYSISQLRNNTAKWCYPTFLKKGSDTACIIEEIYHPLIENCVPNTIIIEKKSVIIAGSNMSGKTTFLRTIGCNNILAQTINTCFANKFNLPFLKTVTSLHNLDNLIESESFYFAEAKNLLRLLDGDINTSYLIIVDEIFKGTNSLERSAISKATLNYLHQYCGVVLATTHDLELINFLTENFTPYHFSENFTDDEIVFDYKIKKGELYIFNAIKTLIKMGFPKALIMEAEQTFNSLEQKYFESNNKLKAMIHN